MSLNNSDTHKLAGAIELLLESSSRLNEAKPRRYWYPLSLASYGVDEIVEALDSLCSFRTTMWEKTLRFEREFSQYQNCADSVMVNSGSSADLLMTFLLTNPLSPILQPGDEILIPVVTWPTQIWSAMMASLKVRFVDVDPKTLNIDIADLERKIGPRTKALFLVHLMGNPCDMDAITDLANKHGLLIVEDCCEALGSEWNGTKVGNFGIAGSYSFFFSHHMTTMEGGMIACSNLELAESLRILRAHGWVRNVDPSRYNLEKYDIDNRYGFVNWGFNVRPTDVQAGFGLHQLKKLPEFNETRVRLANKFFSFIDTQPFLRRPYASPKANPSWFALPLIVLEGSPFSRDEITQYLESVGVETRPIVAGNIARHPVGDIFPEFLEDSYPGADFVHEQGFYLGLSPLFTENQIDKLVDHFVSFLNRY
jgi:CDP-6-deoxy-D-xylo-4-hexulose-3-dehydrase